MVDDLLNSPLITGLLGDDIVGLDARASFAVIEDLILSVTRE